MPELILKHAASVGTPSNGAVSIYAKSDNSLYTKDSSGNESTIMYEGAGKNRIINGAMQINQRNPTASGAATTDAGYLTDRFYTRRGGSYGGTLTWTYDTDVPTNAQAGRTFKKSLKLLTTQDTTMGTDGYISVGTRIEGHNITDLVGDGYNNGFTLSFWIKNSNIGTYCVSLRNSGANREYIAEYTINAANTWEKKTIVVTSAPTAGGTWDTSTGIGLLVEFTLAIGTDLDDGTNGTWTTGGEWATANQKNWADVASNVWITGVQLEAGTRATNYEFRSFQQELALCQRYYEHSYAEGVVPANDATVSDLFYIGACYTTSGAPCFVFTVKFKVPKRNGSGTLTYYRPQNTLTAGQWGYLDTGGAYANFNNWAVGGGVAALGFYTIPGITGKAVADSAVAGGGWSYDNEL